MTAALLGAVVALLGSLFLFSPTYLYPNLWAVPLFGAAGAVAGIVGIQMGGRAFWASVAFLAALAVAALLFALWVVNG